MPVRAAYSRPPALRWLVVGVNGMRAHDGSLDLVSSRERILKTFKVTGLTKVFGTYGWTRSSRPGK